MRIPALLYALTALVFMSTGHAQTVDTRLAYTYDYIDKPPIGRLFASASPSSSLSPSGMISYDQQIPTFSFGGTPTADILGEATLFLAYDGDFDSAHIVGAHFSVGNTARSRGTSLVSVNLFGQDTAWLATGKGRKSDGTEYVWTWRSAFELPVTSERGLTFPASTTAFGPYPLVPQIRSGTIRYLNLVAGGNDAPDRTLALLVSDRLISSVEFGVNTRQLVAHLVNVATMEVVTETVIDTAPDLNSAFDEIAVSTARTSLGWAVAYVKNKNLFVAQINLNGSLGIAPTLLQSGCVPAPLNAFFFCRLYSNLDVAGGEPLGGPVLPFQTISRLAVSFSQRPDPDIVDSELNITHDQKWADAGLPPRQTVVRRTNISRTSRSGNMFVALQGMNSTVFGANPRIAFDVETRSNWYLVDRAGYFPNPNLNGQFRYWNLGVTGVVVDRRNLGPATWSPHSADIAFGAASDHPAMAIRSFNFLGDRAAGTRNEIYGVSVRHSDAATGEVLGLACNGARLTWFGVPGRAPYAGRDGVLVSLSSGPPSGMVAFTLYPRAEFGVSSDPCDAVEDLLRRRPAPLKSYPTTTNAAGGAVLSIDLSDSSYSPNAPGLLNGLATGIPSQFLTFPQDYVGLWSWFEFVASSDGLGFRPQTKASNPLVLSVAP